MIKELKAHHRKICQLSFEGYTNTEIAEKLSLATKTVSTILSSPLGKAYVNGMQDRIEETTLDVRQKLISLNQTALTAIESILDPKKKAPFAVQLNAAKDILDRNGYKAPDKYNIDLTLSGKSDEEIEAELTALEADISRTYKSDINEDSGE